MSPILKKSIAGAAALFLAFIAYYGTYLPLQKSQLFIRTVRGMNGARSVEEFKALFEVPLRVPSPIGQEELVRNMASEIAGFIGRGTTSPDIEEDLVRFVESYFNPIVARGKGMSFEQDLYILGTLERILHQHTKKPEHLEAAEQFFLEGLELGPKRPQFLYGLLDIYLLKGDAEHVKIIADEIHSLWPSDTRVVSLLQVLKESTSTSPTSTKKKAK